MERDPLAPAQPPAVPAAMREVDEVAPRSAVGDPTPVVRMDDVVPPARVDVVDPVRRVDEVPPARAVEVVDLVERLAAVLVVAPDHVAVAAPVDPVAPMPAQQLVGPRRPVRRAVATAAVDLSLAVDRRPAGMADLG